MKHLLVFPALLISLSFSVKKENAFLPPGTVRINDTLFADETEISNFSWLEYETYVKTKYGDESPEHKAAKPDLSVWLRDGMTSNEPYSSVYYTSPAYRDYPVVGISYDQALAYCQWRSEVVNVSISRSKNLKAGNVLYRLPSRQEWELIEGNGAEVFYRKNEVVCVKNTKDERMYRVNYQTRCYINDSISSSIYTSAVASFAKNRFRMYNMIGNVSEMVQEKGVSKGGSWKHFLEECRVGRNISYTRPEAWLGFRCVCIVKR